MSTTSREEDRVVRHGLSVARVLDDFLEHEALPGSGVASETFWTGLARLVETRTPENRALLAERARLQAEIDTWHRDHPAHATDAEAGRAVLASIGYLEPVVAPRPIETRGVDPEIATLAAPQLVVPVTNARYALNAANAR